MIRLDVSVSRILTGPTESCRFTTFHANDPTFTVRRVSFTVRSQDGLFELNVDDAYAVPKLHLNRKPVDIKDIVSRFEYLRDIEHELPLTGGEVTVLIGIDNPSAHEVIQYRTDPDRPRSPHATLTPFGWCLVGPFAPYTETHTKKCFGVTLGNNPDRPSLSELMERLFDVDIFGIQPKEIDIASPDEQRALRILETTIRFTGERYDATKLWKTDYPRLPDNRLTSLKRFYALERRRVGYPYLAAKYVTVIEEYLSYDHAKVLTAEEANVRPIGRTWYLPHHPVLNPNKPNKLRVVFDAAAKSQGISLNSELLKGPDFLANLVGVLLRFRRYRYACTADIVKMFHQVRVRQEDVSALRFFWRNPGTHDEPREYQMNVQIFGATSSPCVCAYALRQAARDARDAADLIHSQIVDHFYVDNWLASFRSVEEAVGIADTLDTVLTRAGFPLAQWRSTHEQNHGTPRHGLGCCSH
ncbi:hypothetical protein M513_11997 [Trichuris suis]|uniref:Reverse transcriptase domain-containing protein n=1 Tax=Trichuris suis TaxID=68888 RepID=A0A085LQ41_9BILA|nr:hypothetical protein M513_11997 [Trichuris suis]